jgi:tRNA(adenine34) deaminase
MARHIHSREDEFYMALALQQARNAAALGEVPIGAVIVKGPEVVASGHNLREMHRDPTAHAEMIAIREASRTLGGWRLNGCTLYVTLEPCPMCAGAILLARIDRVVYGAADPKGGAVESLMQMYSVNGFNHRPDVTAGICADQCAMMLKEFFQNLRKS